MTARGAGGGTAGETAAKRTRTKSAAKLAGRKTKAKAVGAKSKAKVTRGKTKAKAAQTGQEAGGQMMPLWEVFVRPRTGLGHQHVGSVHATDAEMALRAARDVYTRRGEGVSIWVAPSADITASDPQQSGENFEPAASKIYRHPSFYDIPDEVGHM